MAVLAKISDRQTFVEEGRWGSVGAAFSCALVRRSALSSLEQI